MRACAVPGCPASCGEDLKYIMCGQHWWMVPVPLRKTLWLLWHEGRPFDGYQEACANAVLQVAAQLHHIKRMRSLLR